MPMPSEGGALGPDDRRAAELRQQHEREPDQHREQAAEHVQLGVEVDDHRARISAAIEQVVHGRERLDRPLKRPDGEGRAAREDEAPGRGSCASISPRDQTEQEPETRQHGDPSAHEQERMDRRRLLRLLGGEATVNDEGPLVEAQVHRDP